MVCLSLFLAVSTLHAQAQDSTQDRLKAVEERMRALEAEVQSLRATLAAAAPALPAPAETAPAVAQAPPDPTSGASGQLPVYGEWWRSCGGDEGLQPRHRHDRQLRRGIGT